MKQNHLLLQPYLLSVSLLCTHKECFPSPLFPLYRFPQDRFSFLTTQSHEILFLSPSNHMAHMFCMFMWERELVWSAHRWPSSSCGNASPSPSVRVHSQENHSVHGQSRSLKPLNHKISLSTSWGATTLRESLLKLVEVRGQTQKQHQQRRMMVV